MQEGSPNKPETIVISDLHGRLNSWLSVKKMIQKNPNLNVIILGDAMDRGDYGVEILLQIKELSDLGRVKYLPGNHDEFAYNYLASLADGKGEDDKIYREAFLSLKKNRGLKTMENLSNFSQTVDSALKQGLISKPITLDELTKWLGNQPLQLIQKGSNEMDYAMAHAIFDIDLYNQDRNFNLKKAYDMQRQRIEFR